MIFKYCYITVKIQLNSSHLFTLSSMVALLQKQFNINRLFAHSYIVKPMSFVSELFVCNFTFKCVRSNLSANRCCYYFFTVKWFQLFRSNTNISIKNKSIVSTQWSGFEHCYLTLIISLYTLHSFVQSQMVPSIAMLYQYFNLSTQLKSSTTIAIVST